MNPLLFSNDYEGPQAEEHIIIILDFPNKYYSDCNSEL